MIRILPRYVFRELLGAFVLSLVVIVSLVLAGLALQLVYRGLDVVQIRPIIPYLVIFALPHALPAALLTAAVMTFGRLSGDNEITTIRSSGIHLYVVVMPALLAGLVATVLALHLNCNVMPRTYFTIDRLKLAAGRELATQILKSRGKLTVPPYELTAREVQGDTLKDVTIIEYDADYVMQIWWGKEAAVINNPKTNELALELRHCDSIKSGYRDPTEIRTLTFDRICFPLHNSQLGASVPTEYKHMEMRQLLDERIKCSKYLKSPADLFPDPKRAKKQTKKEVSAIDVEKDAIVAEMRRLATAMKDAKGGISAARAKIGEAQLAVTQAEQQIIDVRAAIANARREFRELEKLTGPEAVQRRTAFNKEISKHQATIDKWKSAADDARAGASGATAQIAGLNKRLASLAHRREAVFRQLEAVIERRAEAAYMHKVALAQLGLREIATEAHQRVGMAFSCLTFMLVGVPLGLITKRGNILIGLAVSFFVVLLVYYPLVLGGQVLIADKYWPIPPLIWTPNVVLAVIGIVLLHRLFRA